MAAYDDYVNQLVDNNNKQQQQRKVKLIQASLGSEFIPIEDSLHRMAKDNPRFVNLMQQLAILAKALCISLTQIEVQKQPNLNTRAQLLEAIISVYRQLIPLVAAFKSITDEDKANVLNHMNSKLIKFKKELANTQDELSLGKT